MPRIKQEQQGATLTTSPPEQTTQRPASPTVHTEETS